MYSNKQNEDEIKEGDTISYTIGEDSPLFYVQSVNYPNKGQIELDEATWEHGNKDGELDVDDDISFDYKKKYKNYKVVLNGIPQSSGSYDFTLSFSVENGQEDSLGFTVKVSKRTEGGEIESGAAPEITKQPSNSSDEKSVKLEVEARVPNEPDAVITYQWYKDGRSISNATNATNASYEAKESGAYYVKVTANGVSVQSATANVVIGEIITIPSSTINTMAPYKIEDGILKVPEPSKAVLSIEITKNGNKVDADSYQWYKVGESSGDDVIITGATSKSYTLLDSVSAFAGYYCQFDVAGRTYQSSIVKVVEKDIKITFTQNLPENSYTKEPLSVKAETDVPCEIEYQWCTTDINSGIDEPIEGENRASYTPQNADRYLCKVTATSKAFPDKHKTQDSNTCDVREKSASDPDRPKNVKINGNISLKEGDKLELSVEHSPVSNGTLSYQWKKGDNNISGATKKMYTKNSVDTSDAGVYSCEVSNTLGGGDPVSAVSNSVTVTVTGSGSSTGSGSGSFDFN